MTGLETVETVDLQAFIPRRKGAPGDAARANEPADGQAKRGHSSSVAAEWSPLAAARAQLASEKPGVVQRVDMIVEQCRIAQENRNYRLNSLGVFDASQNEVRARSMLRVQMHKELSSTSMRLPQSHKEVKLERPDDSLNARLEKMCTKVLKSLHDDTRHPARPTGLAVRIPAAHDKPPRESNLPGTPSGVLRAQPSVRIPVNDLDPEQASHSGSHAHRVGSPARRTASGFSTVSRAPRASIHRVSSNVSTLSRAAPAASTPTRSSQRHIGDSGQDWVASLPPELAAAQIAHLTAVTKQAIRRYHALVTERTQEALTSSGLPAAVGQGLSCVPTSQLAQQLESELKETCAAFTANNPAQEEGKHTSSLPENLARQQLISAALEYVMEQTQELETLQASLPKKELPKQRVKKPSIPRKAQSTVGAQDTATPTHNAANADQSASNDTELWPTLGKTPSLGFALSLRMPGDTSAAGSDTECDAALERHTLDTDSPDTEHTAAQDTALPLTTPRTLRTGITNKKLEALREALAEAESQVASGSYTVPSLPSLPPAPTAALHVQARLERVWDILGLPLTTRLDSVLAFTSRKRALKFELALEVWEKCAACVQARENLLGQLSDLQYGYANGKLGFISLQEVMAKCVELHTVTCAVQALASQLRMEHGILLEYGDGQSASAYPGVDAVGVEDMVRFLEWLRDTDTSVKIYP